MQLIGQLGYYQLPVTLIEQHFDRRIDVLLMNLADRVLARKEVEVVVKASVLLKPTNHIKAAVMAVGGAGKCLVFVTDIGLGCTRQNNYPGIAVSERMVAPIADATAHLDRLTAIADHHRHAPPEVIDCSRTAITVMRAVDVLTVEVDLPVAQVDGLHYRPGKRDQHLFLLVITITLAFVCAVERLKVAAHCLCVHSHLAICLCQCGKADRKATQNHSTATEHGCGGGGTDQTGAESRNAGH
ncbi:hypothetical protein D3C84_539210 [compost metagenome]